MDAKGFSDKQVISNTNTFPCARRLALLVVRGSEELVMVTWPLCI